MENDLVSKEEISKHIQALSFPRRCGSSGEKKAFRYILEHFRNHSLSCDIQNFNFSSSPFSLLARVIPFTILALLVAAALLSTVSTAATLTIAAVLIAVFFLSTRWNRLSEFMAGRSGAQTSNNIIARIPNDEAHKEFVFLAHYDSKSQVFPLYFRVACTFLFLFGFFISLVGIMSVTLNAPFFRKEFLFYPIALCLISVLSAAFNVKGNLSPGAIDNATGIALLLELARIIQKWKDKGTCSYTFVATGAEEEGLIGAIQFIKMFEGLLKNREALFINFDGAGAPGKIIVHDRYGIPPVKTSDRLAKLVLLRARERQMDVSRGYLPPGVGVDAIPIAYHGFEVISFSSRIFNRATFSIHSSRDVPGNIDLDSLEQLAKLTLSLTK